MAQAFAQIIDLLKAGDHTAIVADFFIKARAETSIRMLRLQLRHSAHSDHAHLLNRARKALISLSEVQVLKSCRTTNSLLAKFGPYWSGTRFDVDLSIVHSTLADLVRHSK